MKITPDTGQHFEITVNDFCAFTVVDRTTQQLFEVQIVSDKASGEAAIAVTALDDLNVFNKHVVRAKLEL